MLDTNIVLAAVLSDQGASRQILLDGLASQFNWVCSVALMLGYESVLKRSGHMVDSGLEVADVEALLNSVATVVEPVRLSFLWRPVLKDPNDEMVLETAVNGQADLVVTMDLRHLEMGLKRFGIRAMRPGPALKLLRQEGT